MCGTCGCSDPDNAVTLADPVTGKKLELPDGLSESAAHVHHHGHDHGHDHAHDHGHDAHGRVISLEQAVLAENDLVAERNRGWFAEHGLVAFNLVSSPGAGKTTLLERTISDLCGTVEIAVIEGDQKTSNDAERIRKAGARAIQINTGGGCHLEADMVATAAQHLDPKPGTVLMIENVGNLVCPAMFDLGERLKIVIFSTPEGDDKPLKYPHMFRAAEVVVINKIDLAPFVDFDEARLRSNIAQINPDARIFMVSARTGEGMADWLDFVKSARAASPDRA